MRRNLRCALLLALTAPAMARAQEVPVRGPVSRYAAKELGGIRTILRYAVPRPDRQEIAYVFLGETERDSGLPLQIQVEEADGSPAHLADVEGADCTLERVAIVRTGRRDVALVVATRTFNVRDPLHQVPLNEPSSMDLQIYTREPGGDVGESIPLFRAISPPTITSPVCEPGSVRRALSGAISALTRKHL